MCLVACETENERKSVKEVTQGNLLSWGILIKQENKILPTNAFVLLTENDFPRQKFNVRYLREQREVFLLIRKNIQALFLDR